MVETSFCRILIRSFNERWSSCFQSLNKLNIGVVPTVAPLQTKCD